MSGATLYDVLGVSQDATDQQIKTAYRRLLREHHPDVVGQDGQDEAARITGAWHVLGNPTRRADYDRDLSDPFNSDLPADDEPFEAQWGTQAEWEHVPPESTEPYPDPDEAPAVDDPSPPPKPQPAPETNPEPSAGWRGRWSSDTQATVVGPMRRKRTVFRVLYAVLAVACVVTFISAQLDGRTASSGLVSDIVLAAAGVGIGWVLASYLGLRQTPQLVAIALAVSIPAVEIGIDYPTRYLSRGIYVLLAAAVLGSLWQYTRTRQVQCNGRIPIKSLRENDTFGDPAGGVASDQLGQDTLPLYSIPGVRVVRTPQDNALFSHFIVCGTKVVLVRPILGSPGTYRWHGTSLLRDDPMANWSQEVMRADYAPYVRLVSETLGECAEVKLMPCVVIYSPPAERGRVQFSSPGATEDDPVTYAPDEFVEAAGAFLIRDNDPLLVDQEIVVATANLAAT